jgi:hypothetical protein
MDEYVAQLTAAIEDIGVSPFTLRVAEDQGIVTVYVECFSPSNPFLVSAIHVAVGLVDADARVDVHVHPPDTVAPLAKWNLSQIAHVQSWYLDSRKTLETESVHHVIDLYPWRNKAIMRSRVHCLIASKRQCDVDTVLPKEVVVPEVEQEVRLALRREPVDRLETYEIVYALARAKKATALETYELAGRLFNQA